jgi:ankyrin repeat protein
MTSEEFLITSAHGDVSRARAALAEDASLASVRDDAGISVVARVVYAGRVDLAREIASVRSDLDVHEASCLGDSERVESLLGADPSLLDAVAPDGFRPIGFAAFFGHVDLLTRLIERGADLASPSSNEMRVAPLHSAVAHADQAVAIEMAEALLVAGAEPDARQQQGYAPLHEAALNGNLALTELLLRHGADPSPANDAGETPVDLARSKGHEDVARALAEAAST